VETGPGFFRRLVRRLFSAPVIIPVVFISAIVLGVLIYYWTVFSGRIDNLLAGEVYTRTAGIYAAPKQLRVNETISQAEVIAFLKRAGYVEKSQQADTGRGRYACSLLVPARRLAGSRILKPRARWSAPGSSLN
jgi:hypothetical protein